MWQPKCVALATNEGMLLEASLPGVKREDIDLRIIDGDLILSGERKEEQLSRRAPHRSRRLFMMMAVTLLTPRRRVCGVWCVGELQRSSGVGCGCPRARR
jgi:hypothetical protein